MLNNAKETPSSIPCAEYDRSLYTYSSKAQQYDWRACPTENVGTCTVQVPSMHRSGTNILANFNQTRCWRRFDLAATRHYPAGVQDTISIQSNATRTNAICPALRKISVTTSNAPSPDHVASRSTKLPHGAPVETACHQLRLHTATHHPLFSKTPTFLALATKQGLHQHSGTLYEQWCLIERKLIMTVTSNSGVLELHNWFLFPLPLRLCSVALVNEHLLLPALLRCWCWCCCRCGFT